MTSVKKVLFIFLLINIAIFQTGCWDQKIFEKIGFMLQLGVEIDKEGRVIYTTTMPIITGKADRRAEIVSTPINLMREGRNKARLVSGKAVEGGKVQQLFFSEEIAAKGIDQFMEIFLRSPENPLLANVVVVEGSPRELMEFSVGFEDKPRPTFYVNGLLESARRSSNVPETRISHFSIMSHSGTIDPTTPLVRYNKKDIQIAGSALFDGDKMVGKIGTKETGLLAGLMGKKKDIGYIYTGPYSRKEKYNLKNGAALALKLKKRKIEVSFEKGSPKIDMKLEFKGSINEYSGDLDLSNQEEQLRFEKAAGDAISQDCMNLIKYLEEVGSDPIGFGEILRSKHNAYWKSTQWKEAYKDLSVTVDTKLEIEFYGAVINP